MTAERRSALRVLRAVRRGRRLDRALAQEKLDAPQRAAVRRLVSDACRFRARFDHLLARYVHRGLNSLEPDVLDALRLGASQILHDDSVPDYAAVSQTVEQVRSVSGAGAAGLSNAVLRRLGEAGLDPAHFPDPDVDVAGYLTTWGSHPRWLVHRWLTRWGPEETRSLVEIDNEPPPIHLRPVRGDRAALLSALAEMGVQATAVREDLPTVRVDRVTDLRAILHATGSIVQDAAAGLVPAYAALEPGSMVADLCAAPGGKSIGLWCEGADRVVAADRSRARLALVVETAERLGAPISPLVADATLPALGEVDAVLLDAPCTGTGTLRRHPDARWRVGPKRLDTLTAVQTAMLAAASTIVRAGGLLVYATCSLEPEENEAQIERFLARHGQFSLEASATLAGDLTDPDGRLMVLPQRTGFDGAFAARLRRIE